MSSLPPIDHDDDDGLAMSGESYPVIEFSPWLGLFETIRVVKGHPLLLTEHRQNLREGSSALGLPNPPDFSSFASALPPKDGRWRWIHEAHGSRHFFQMESPQHPQSYSLKIAAQRIGSQNWDARFKTLSYLTHWQARRAVSTHEALLLNEYGEIASGSMSNIFWVQKGQLYTPTLEVGCRNGAVRRWVEENFQPQTVRASVQALVEAEEIFLTNSMIGIRPVGQFEGQEKPIGPQTTEILKTYERSCVDGEVG